eukprot:TRINITY_DN7161_c0_g1_i1.p1 TRINITY_DN7161_c0_g1~~TRINITY_DN7161_c0_g1_i1.p1  ORF type:complete len:206 (+),score=29.25 TRINITY_DN7161_c0_g1_i1:33-620(+)
MAKVTSRRDTKNFCSAIVREESGFLLIGIEATGEQASSEVAALSTVVEVGYAETLRPLLLTPYPNASTGKFRGELKFQRLHQGAILLFRYGSTPHGFSTVELPLPGELPPFPVAINPHNFSAACRIAEVRVPSPASAPEDESKKCIVCIDRDRTHTILPCGHFHFCGTCIEQLLADKRECPSCRGPVNGVLRIHS